MFNETMNFSIIGVKGRTPWLLNKAEARRKGKNTWMLRRETWLVLISEYSAVWGIYYSGNSKNLHVSCSSLLDDGNILISKI